MDPQLMCPSPPWTVSRWRQPTSFGCHGTQDLWVTGPAITARSNPEPPPLEATAATRALGLEVGAQVHQALGVVGVAALHAPLVLLGVGGQLHPLPKPVRPLRRPAPAAQRGHHAEREHQEEDRS